MDGALHSTTSELYHLVASIEGLDGQSASLASMPSDLGAKASDLHLRLVDAASSSAGRLSSRLHGAASDLHALASALEGRVLSREELRLRWRALSASYEALQIELKQEGVAALPSLKPRNYARNIFHLSGGLLGVLAYEATGNRLFTALLCSSIFLGFIGLDLGRRLVPRFNTWLVEVPFGKISRPHEHLQIPSSVWYVGALMVGVIWLPQPAIELGALVLAFGDPAASLIGKKFGRHKLVGQKSLEGSLALWAVGALVSALALPFIAPSLTGLAILKLSVGSALAAALAELFTGPFDDNLTVPLAAALAATALL